MSNKKQPKDKGKNNKNNPAAKNKSKKAPEDKQADAVDKPEPPPEPVNPFLNKQFLTENKSVSVMVTDPQPGKKVTKTVTHYEKISKKRALDVFCESIKKELDMTSGGIKTFRYLYSKVQNSIGLNAENLSLYVDKANCMKEAKYTSIQSVFNGINELIGKGIIAKSGKLNIYFINPNFFRPADFLIITEYYRVNGQNSAK